jgi:prepilin-type N-terminal cleavage/methylation domain-containing protein
VKRGFSLIEAMVAISLAGVVAATVIATFKGAIDEQSRSKHDWQAFTLAQQQMERWSAMPRTSVLLDENAPSANPGSAADATCSGVTAGERHQRMDGLGNADVNGVYDVCVKVTDGSPEGSLKNVRVVVEYKNATGATEHIMLQTVR